MRRGAVAGARSCSPDDQSPAAPLTVHRLWRLEDQQLLGSARGGSRRPGRGLRPRVPVLKYEQASRRALRGLTPGSKFVKAFLRGGCADSIQPGRFLISSTRSHGGKAFAKPVQQRLFESNRGHGDSLMHVRVLTSRGELLRDLQLNSRRDYQPQART